MARLSWFYAAVIAVTLVGVAAGRYPRLRMNRATIALVGATVLMLVGAISLDQALRAVDLHTLSLLLAMMILNANLRLAGLFGLVTARVVRWARTPRQLLALLIAAAGLLSALFLNDTVVLVFTPLVVEVTATLLDDARRRSRETGAQSGAAGASVAAAPRGHPGAGGGRAPRRAAGTGADASVLRAVVAPRGVRPPRAGADARRAGGGAHHPDAGDDPPGHRAGRALSAAADAGHAGPQDRRHRAPHGRDGAPSVRGRRSGAAGRRAAGGARGRPPPGRARHRRVRYGARLCCARRRAAGAGSAARRVGSGRAGEIRGVRGVDRPRARLRAFDRRAGAPLPRDLRPRLGHGHAELVGPDATEGGVRAAAPAARDVPRRGRRGAVRRARGTAPRHRGRGSGTPAGGVRQRPAGAQGPAAHHSGRLPLERDVRIEAPVA